MRKGGVFGLAAGVTTAALTISILNPNGRLAAANQASSAPRAQIIDSGMAKLMALSIRLSGGLCDRPLAVTPAGEANLFTVECVAHIPDGHQSNYLVNASTARVARL